MGPKSRFRPLLVLLDIPDTALLVSESLGRVVSAQLLDELSCAAGDVAREIDRVDALQDDVVRLHRVGAGEWGSAWLGKEWQ